MLFITSPNNKIINKIILNNSNLLYIPLISHEIYSILQLSLKK